MSETQNPPEPDQPQHSKNVARPFSTFKYETRPALIALLRSEDGARRVLGRILSDNFDYFAVRYVNIEQYKQYVTQGYSVESYTPFAGAGEANGFHGQPFREFFRQHHTQWQKSVEKQTDWPISSKAMNWHTEFDALLKESKKEAQAQKTMEESLRQKTMKIFQRKMLAQIDEGIKEDRIFAHHPFTKKYHAFTNVRQINGIPDLKTLQKQFGKDGWCDRKLTDSQIEAMYRFFNTPEAMTAKDIRELKTIIVETPVSELSMRGDQYHVAVIFDPKVLKAGKDDNFWGKPAIGQEWWSDMKGEPEKAILAAIPLLNDRTMTEKIVELSRSRGELAHPVIDSKGNVRYPGVKMNILELE